MKRLALILTPWLVLATAALAQGVLQQAGPATQGHVPSYRNPAQVDNCRLWWMAARLAAAALVLGSVNSICGPRQWNYRCSALCRTGHRAERRDRVRADGQPPNPTGYHYLCLSANIGGGNAVISCSCRRCRNTGHADVYHQWRYGYACGMFRLADE